MMVLLGCGGCRVGDDVGSGGGGSGGCGDLAEETAALCLSLTFALSNNQCQSTTFLSLNPRVARPLGS